MKVFKKVTTVVLVVIGVCLMAPLSVVSSELEIYGYFEPQYFCTSHNNPDYFWNMSINKLRIDIGNDLTDKISFKANYNVIQYDGKTSWDVFDSTSQMRRFTNGRIRYGNENELDNAYLRFTSNHVTLTVGKQQISVGPGYTWNPTDLFNTKDIVDPTYEQPGVDGLRLDLRLYSDYSLLLFYSPEDNWTESGKLAQFHGRLGHFDFNLSYGLIMRQLYGYRTLFSQQNMYGFDFNGEILGLGCWSEITYKDVEGIGSYGENVYGLDYTFSSGWYLMAEYYQNGQGLTDDSKYTRYDWFNYLRGYTKTVAAEQVYTYTEYPLTDLLNVGGGLAYAISDNSLMIIPTVEYSISDEITLSFIGSIFTGKYGTMYTKELMDGYLFRLRAYF